VAAAGVTGVAFAPAGAFVAAISTQAPRNAATDKAPTNALVARNFTSSTGRLAAATVAPAAVVVIVIAAVVAALAAIVIVIVVVVAIALAISVVTVIVIAVTAVVVVDVVERSVVRAVAPVAGR
jgi:hypothetical protein